MLFNLQTLLNKAAFSNSDASIPISILLFQCILSVLLTQMFQAIGCIQISPLTWEVIKIWSPVNILFAAMLMTSALAMRELSVPIVTVIKSTSNIFVLVAEYFTYKKIYSWHTWATAFMLVLSAVVVAIADLNHQMNSQSYVWQIVNTGCTAAYLLCLKYVT